VPVVIDPAEVMQNLHGQYADVVANLMQENAELTAALRTTAQERDEWKAKADAARAAAGVAPMALPGGGG